MLRDIVGPGGRRSRSSAPACAARSKRVTARSRRAEPEQRSFGDGVAVLRRGHRSVAAIGTLAEAIRAGDGDGAVAALDAGLEKHHLDPRTRGAELGTRCASMRVAAYAPMIAAARAGDAATALQQLAGIPPALRPPPRAARGRRSGPTIARGWLRADVKGFEPGPQRYAGLPLLATRNDYELRLHNGDTGVVVARAQDGELRAVFDAGGTTIELAPSRLADVEPLFATTVHKSQGSEFDVAALMLPEPDSPLLSRELLYTAVTRARHTLVLAGQRGGGT